MFGLHSKFEFPAKNRKQRKKTTTGLLFGFYSTAKTPGSTSIDFGRIGGFKASDSGPTSFSDFGRATGVSPTTLGTLRRGGSVSKEGGLRPAVSLEGIKTSPDAVQVGKVSGSTVSQTKDVGDNVDQSSTELIDMVSSSEKSSRISSSNLSGSILSEELREEFMKEICENGGMERSEVTTITPLTSRTSSPPKEELSSTGGLARPICRVSEWLAHNQHAPTPSTAELPGVIAAPKKLEEGRRFIAPPLSEKGRALLASWPTTSTSISSSTLPEEESVKRSLSDLSESFGAVTIRRSRSRERARPSPVKRAKVSLESCSALSVVNNYVNHEKTVNSKQLASEKVVLRGAPDPKLSTELVSEMEKIVRKGTKNTGASTSEEIQVVRGGASDPKLTILASERGKAVREGVSDPKLSIPLASERDKAVREGSKAIS